MAAAKLTVASRESTSTEKILATARVAGIEVQVATGGGQTPCGLPVPEFCYGQLKVRHTNAILRRLAQSSECGLLGDNFLEEGQVDSWLDWGSLYVDHQALDSNAPLDPIICDSLEGQLKQTGPHLVGKFLTVADIALSISVRALLGAKGLEEKKKSHPGVVRWLETCQNALTGGASAQSSSKSPKAAAPGSPAQGPGGVKLSQADKKKAKEDAKKAKEEEKAKREAEQKAAADNKFKGPDVTLETMDKFAFGNLFIRSEVRTDRKWTDLKALTSDLKGTKVWIRARVHNSRKQGGKLCFLTLRRNIATVQAVVFGAEMAGFAGALPDESVIDIFGEVSCPDVPINSCTQKDVEVQVEKVFCIGRSQPLPLQLADAGRPETDYDKDPSLVRVGQDVRLDNRVIDLRTQANQAIFRIQSGVCMLFREFLSGMNFTEIHTPKLIGSASEGGADVFRLDYFDGNAYLAQSPQLYKQMVLMADMGRVFEIAPVFRSEKSFTHRHMTEFMGLDMEMCFKDHYHEVLDVLDGMFNHIFKGLNERYKDEIEAVRRQYPFEDLKWKYPCRRFTFKEATALLKKEGPKIVQARLKNAANDHEAGIMQRHIESMKAHGPLDDISTEDEKVLGEVVSNLHGEQFYIIDKFPTEVRPFYSMRDPKDPKIANAYDFFLRGEEITSGAQRVHDAKMLVDNAAEKGIDLHQPYVDAFKYGTFPHAGAGIGLERVVMLFCNLNNIRKTSLFPRDPKRVHP